MNPKTLQYLMGHSDIGVTITHLGLEDAAAEMTRMEEVESARREQQKLSGGRRGQTLLLDVLVGKTGKELFDAGWRSGSFYNTETLEVWLEYGPFAYKMHFDGKIPPEKAEDFDVYEDLADKKVLDAAYEGLGDASYME